MDLRNENLMRLQLKQKKLGNKESINELITKITELSHKINPDM